MEVGAVVIFTGLVREFESLDKFVDSEKKLSGLALQHYPKMTENLISKSIDEANTRWLLNGITVIHRVGHLQPNDQIVFVGVASQHRQQAFEAAQFLMDYLKTKATLWKQVLVGGEWHWIDAKESDNDAITKWDAN